MTKIEIDFPEELLRKLQERITTPVDDVLARLDRAMADDRAHSALQAMILAAALETYIKPEAIPVTRNTPMWTEVRHRTRPEDFTEGPYYFVAPSRKHDNSFYSETAGGFLYTRRWAEWEVVPHAR